jgi:hypothetical protein
MQKETFGWSVRIDDTLRQPITILAVNQKTEIRKIVSEALRNYLANKVGE